MSDLTIVEMKAKVEKVKKDIAELMTSGQTGRKLEVLIEYKEYLEDELEMLKREQSSAK